VSVRHSQYKVRVGYMVPHHNPHPTTTHTLLYSHPTHTPTSTVYTPITPPQFDLPLLQHSSTALQPHFHLNQNLPQHPSTSQPTPQFHPNTYPYTHLYTRFILDTYSQPPRTSLHYRHNPDPFQHPRNPKFYPSPTITLIPLPSCTLPSNYKQPHPGPVMLFELYTSHIIRLSMWTIWNSLPYDLKVACSLSACNLKII